VNLWYRSICDVNDVAECADGYWGDQCANKCRCISHGSCDKAIGCTSCDQPGWSGADCNEDVNECLNASYYCGNNSHCVNMNGSFSCTCQPWYQRQLDTCVCKLAECRLYTNRQHCLFHFLLYRQYSRVNNCMAYQSVIPTYITGFLLTDKNACELIWFQNSTVSVNRHSNHCQLDSGCYDG